MPFIFNSVKCVDFVWNAFVLHFSCNYNNKSSVLKSWIFKRMHFEGQIIQNFPFICIKFKATHFIWSVVSSINIEISFTIQWNSVMSKSWIINDIKNQKTKKPKNQKTKKPKSSQFIDNIYIDYTVHTQWSISHLNALHIRHINLNISQTSNNMNSVHIF